MEKIGLFLGAGASYELGMPLVSDVTHEVKRWLTPDKLRMFNQTWRTHGTGHPDEVVEDFIRVLALPDLHYESLLGHLETQFIRNGPHRNSYYGLYSWLIEAIYVILQERHVRNVAYIQKNIRFYEGLRALLPNKGPLWVFSLNHDLMVECLAVHFGIQLSAGFDSEEISLPKRDRSGRKFGELRARVLKGDILEKNAMPFLGHETSGINLLKIHGSLDVFTFRDGKDLLQIFPTDPSIAGWIECLRSANEELVYIDPRMPGGKVKALNEIAYADDSGEMQFLRRTLLSGAYKYDQRMSQVLPKKLLDHFKSNLNAVSTLVSVGYGFGDEHINNIIKSWLGFSASRKLEIVDPGRSSVPPTFLHLTPQIRIMNLSFTDYLDSIAQITRSQREVLEKRLSAWARKNQFDSNKKNEFEEFIQTSLDVRLHSLVRDIALASQ